MQPFVLYWFQWGMGLVYFGRMNTTWRKYNLLSVISVSSQTENDAPMACTVCQWNLNWGKPWGIGIFWVSFIELRVAIQYSRLFLVSLCLKEDGEIVNWVHSDFRFTYGFLDIVLTWYSLSKSLRRFVIEVLNSLQSSYTSSRRPLYVI